VHAGAESEHPSPTNQLKAKSWLFDTVNPRNERGFAMNKLTVDEAKVRVAGRIKEATMDMWLLGGLILMIISSSCSLCGFNLPKEPWGLIACAVLEISVVSAIPAQIWFIRRLLRRIDQQVGDEYQITAGRFIDAVKRRYGAE
jgi:hypothetical protein